MKGTLTMYRPNSIGAAVTMLALLLMGASAAQAQTLFTVSLDTSSLIGNINSPFSLDFQLNDGSGTGDGNNTATLTNFTFGAGAATGTATTSGGALGDLSSGITITDNSFLNELYQSFTPGNMLRFDVLLTGNADVGLTPDQFSFAILDNTLSEIPTNGGFGAFLTADIIAQGVSVQTFAGADAYSAIGAPTIAAAAPEPSVGAFGILSAGLLLGMRAGKRKG